MINKKNDIINSRILISPNRLDIGFKLLFIEGIENSSFDKIRAYEQHIYAITEGTLIENGNEIKSGLDKFKSDFKDIYSSLRDKGFDNSISNLPLSINGSILDGAHRLASAIYLDLDVYVKWTGDESKKYNYEYFLRRGVEEKYIKLALSCLSKYTDKIRLACVWPVASKYKNKLIDKIDNKNILYVQDSNVNLNGVKNLVVNFYQGESWLGTKNNNYSGALGKAEPCYKEGKEASFIWFLDETEDLITFKDEFRKEINSNKHSIHMTDTGNETRVVSEILLSPDFELIINNLDYGKSEKYLSMVEFEINRLLTEYDIEKKDLIVVGSGFWNILNIRQSSDVDFICNPSFKIDIESHNKYFDFFKYDLNDYFSSDNRVNYIGGVKYISIEEMLDFKKNRNEEKDKLDIKLLGGFYNPSIFSKKINSFNLLLLKKKTKIKFFVAKILKEMNLFDFVQLIRGRK
ncbi:hypothetical protein [Aliivibrio fischeri]|uniref:Uncharacterized protein n=1 Tax=Aliivibrio fischeri TaxID=668 RepID=A0A510UK94_ALIFS|nr:hypothetical protein [Aliivibrio fischeri]GEK15062.1 hypothetical protein AFI02nite_30980 [Aliivibrio fischeri]